MSFNLRLAQLSDLPLLAQFNQQLIQDEGSLNPMNVMQLEQRMANFLGHGYQAVLIDHEAQTIGYMLFRVIESNPPRLDDGIFVRQFFIHRTFRRQGFGKQAFEQISQSYFPPDITLTLEVLAHNEAGIAFWNSLGFATYAHTMQRNSHSEQFNS